MGQLTPTEPSARSRVEKIRHNMINTSMPLGIGNMAEVLQAFEAAVRAEERERCAEIARLKGMDYLGLVMNHVRPNGKLPPNLPDYTAKISAAADILDAIQAAGDA